MGYGARARRVPALGGATLTDIDVYKLLLLCKTERGIVDSNGYPVVHEEIYSMNDFYPKCGGFNSSYYGAYVLKSFYDELLDDISCESKVLSFVDSSAVQASYAILDESGTKIFDFYSGYKSLADKSAFGNKIAIKIEQVEEVTMKLTSDINDAATSCVLDGVDNLEIGNYIKFTEGNDIEVRVITGITASTKTVTFAAITESSGFSASGTTVSRIDLKIKIAVKDNFGNYDEKEEWEGPFAKSNTIGISGDINDEVTGSEYGYLTVNTSNSSTPINQIPAELTSWTALTSGSDGSAPDDDDWESLADSYLSSVDFMIMLAPESSSIAHNENMIDFCTTNYKGCYYAQAANEAGEASLKNFGASLRGTYKFGMLPSDKWIAVDDDTKISGTIDIPKVGIDAAFWFNTYNRFGESKVAAGNKGEMVLHTTGTLRDSNGLVHDDLDGVGGRLIRNYSINICRYKKGKGITNNSARTFSTDKGYTFQNQIMQFLIHSKSIVAFLREIEQDKAGYSAQESHYNTVWAYFNGKFNAGHLWQGQKEDGTFTTFSDVCKIVNDFRINTLANIANGIEETFVQCVYPVPIEEPILSLASAAVTTVRG